MEPVNYETLVSEFNKKLVTQLRNHGAEVEFLEMWVPDEDPVRSIENMVEAVQAYGQSQVQIQISEQTISDNQLQELQEKIRSIGGEMAQQQGTQGWLLTVTGL